MKTLSLALSILVVMAIITEAADRPNVVIIYGDDVGYADVGVYGSKLIPTPNIDKLAGEGLMLTHAADRPNIVWIVSEDNSIDIEKTG